VHLEEEERLMADSSEQARRHTILIVDDAAENVALMSSVLKASYRTKVAREGETALRLSSMDGSPDLILLDVMMPGMDGYEVCRRLKANPKTADIPVIFITARSDIDDEQRGLDLGAVDYITKPISPPILAARVRTHLRLKSMRDFLRDKSEFLEQEVQQRTRQISAIQDAMMVALGSLAETRDNETGNHIRRTQHYVMALARKMSEHSALAETLTPDIIQLLYKSAPLHDIGKVGIPDRILLKPGKLTAEEFEIMKTHTTLGRNAILTAERLLDSPTTFLRIAREIAWTHHERWDGTGYPQGLAGNDIPLPGRLMAVVDVYDALVSKRIYKPAMPHDAALAIIKEGIGTHFDARVVEGFLEFAGQLPEISRRFSDEKGDSP
jgi:putative two-component system response regulator